MLIDNVTSAATSVYINRSHIYNFLELHSTLEKDFYHKFSFFKGFTEIPFAKHNESFLLRLDYIIIMSTHYSSSSVRSKNLACCLAT